MKRTDEASLRRSRENKKIAASSVVLVACYVVILVVFFLLIIAVTDWRTFISSHRESEVAYCVNLFFLFVVGFVYFYVEERSLLFKPSNVVMYTALVLSSVVLCWALGNYVSIYCRPYAFFSLMCLFLFGRKHALFLNAIFALFMFVTDLFTANFAETLNNGIYSVLIIGFASGLLSVFIAGGAKTRLRLLFVGVFVSLPSMLMTFLVRVPFITSEGWEGSVEALGFCALGCVISAILALALLPLFESLFNRLTPFRLRELTSTDMPLLARLKKEAPGTFNHSIVVAQLSEVCAIAIGENAELARASAYYHDVGKLKQPDCFTENQTDYNVHNELTPELSADIIRSHAKDGYELLVQYHLPREIADVAREHHGTLPIKYFYEKAMRISGGESRIEDFAYFGPKPQSRIAAIIMIADGAEAATRALPDHSAVSVERTVRGIIEERMDLGQFDECDITMRELTIIKETLVSALSGVYHHRVRYPNIRFTRGQKTVKEDDDDDE